MPIAVQAVSPAVFRQWVVAKGGKLPGQAEAAAPTSNVIPQPGATGNEAPGSNTQFSTPPAGPNPTTAPVPATPQGATQNSGGLGPTGT